MSTTLVKPYTTVERIKNECRLKLTETDNDDWIKTCINDASRAIERVCDSVFWETEYTSESPYRVPPESVFHDSVLLHLPVISLTAVLYGDDKDVIDADDYDWRNLGYGAVILLLEGVTDSYWYKAITQLKNPKVYFAGKLGYAVTEGQETPPETMPTEIVRAATIIASAWTGMFQRESISYDGQRNSVTDTRIPDEAMKLLKPFRRLVV